MCGPGGCREKYAHALDLALSFYFYDNVIYILKKWHLCTIKRPKFHPKNRLYMSLIVITKAGAMITREGQIVLCKLCFVRPVVRMVQSEK